MSKDRNRAEDKYYQAWVAALLPLHFEDKLRADGTFEVLGKAGCPVLMEYANHADRQRFLKALLELSWLSPEIRRAAAKALGISLRQRNVEREAGRTTVLKQMVAEVEARMRAARERPSKGDVHTAAIEEVAQKVGIGPEALKKRIQRIQRGHRLRH